MKCEKCGKEIKTLMIDLFNSDGNNYFFEYPAIECEEDAVYSDINQDWTGYELSEEEQLETITCPFCKKFPFNNTEIQVHNIVRIVCFKEEDNEIYQETHSS